MAPIKTNIIPNAFTKSIELLKYSKDKIVNIIPEVLKMTPT